MKEHRCEVRVWKHDPECARCAGQLVFDEDCPQCRIGCFKIAMFRNPAYDPDGLGRGLTYRYAEWLCESHYDEVMDMIHRYEADALEPWEESIVNDEENDWDGNGGIEGT